MLLDMIVNRIVNDLIKFIPTAHQKRVYRVLTKREIKISCWNLAKLFFSRVYGPRWNTRTHTHTRAQKKEKQRDTAGNPKRARQRHPVHGRGVASIYARTPVLAAEILNFFII